MLRFLLNSFSAKVPLLHPLEDITKIAEAATEGVQRKKVFLEILQNSQENTCARVSFLIKLQAYTFFIEHLWTTAS